MWYFPNQNKEPEEVFLEPVAVQAPVVSEPVQAEPVVETQAPVFEPEVFSEQPEDGFSMNQG
ncbi:MAG: hypothetical protein FWC00_01000 [Firmicutes bacterium]|nr:hypothetical protein [Bacillota bacterium]